MNNQECVTEKITAAQLEAVALLQRFGPPREEEVEAGFTDGSCTSHTPHCLTP